MLYVHRGPSQTLLHRREGVHARALTLKSVRIQESEAKIYSLSKKIPDQMFSICIYKELVSLLVVKPSPGHMSLGEHL